ncbi:repeat domain in Vibrio, Colwellia, Bradyrhizobium and Shewanella family protein [Paenibacillus macerans]|uniref:Repeat domain in Vibrio, Colwellia, Bradyrhizobium and Shewanella family protein n=2 Tax=Paenibacillus macerans TaxID=44252 RepID=A0A090ZX93_PAEMA|nr:repeat domain in Vibrio, Colwellia, Bradyrhizobium and Shewanella family protein [Paenibacillus macerans]
MMLAKRWCTVIAGFFLLMVLSGCSFISDPKSLMQTPQLSSDKASLISVIKSELKGGEIISPRDVRNSSSIRTPDLNNDGVKEAVVFYQTPDEAVRIHGMILEREKDTWALKARFDGEGQELETFDVLDLTGDGNLEIIAGFSNGGDGLQKGLTVYSYHEGAVEKMMALPYDYFMVDDLNQDGQPDITVVSLKRQQFATVTAYQYADGSFQQLSQLELNDPVSDYYNAVSGNITPKLKGIILDASVGTHSAFSTIIVMKDGQFVNLLPSQDMTLKGYPIMSGDVNNDGVLEVGMLEKPKGWEYISFDEIPWLFTYYQWDEKDGLKSVMQQYMDMAGRFYFNFPKEWRGNVTIDTKSDKNEHLWFVKTDTNEVVAEIRFFTLSEWEKNKADWQFLAQDTDRVIGFLSHTDLKVNKGETEIKR